MTNEVLNLYRDLSLGGIGLIITGGIPVFKARSIINGNLGKWIATYNDLKVEGIEQLAHVVHSSNKECRIIAQLENGHLNAGPSEIDSPFSKKKVRRLTMDEINDIVECFVDGIIDMKNKGFDGCQLHAAHGGLLSRFLSPYTNRRDDAYGGSVAKRARIIRDIVFKARSSVGDFPILIKMNCTDYLTGGTDSNTFPTLAQEIERIGIDAIEVSGGMWECLLRSEEELGFRPVPAPESHTRIKNPEKQSYFLEFVEHLDLDIPIILVGGNRDVERLENVVRKGKVDLISLSRPLIREPDLPNRWLEGRGNSKTACISCNSCIYSMYKYQDRLVTCVQKSDQLVHRTAQEWLSSWVKRQKGR
jgi:2,4-dienoyl-CoA reductase-like NADH-dependent reductase (Old Yellow Enzyme family)